MQERKWRHCGHPSCSQNFPNPGPQNGAPDFDNTQNPAPPIYVPGSFLYQNYFPGQKPWEQFQSGGTYCETLTNIWSEWDAAVGHMLCNHYLCFPFSHAQINPPPQNYPQLCQSEIIGQAQNHVWPCARFHVNSKNAAMREAAERLCWFLLNTNTNIDHIQQKIGILSRMQCAQNPTLFSASHGKTPMKYVYLLDDADVLGFVVLPIVWLLGHDCAGEAPELRNDVRDFDLRIELPQDPEERVIVIAAAALYIWDVYMTYKHGTGHFIYENCVYPSEVPLPLGCACPAPTPAVWSIPWVDGVSSLSGWYAHRWARVRVDAGQTTFETWFDNP